MPNDQANKHLTHFNKQTSMKTNFYPNLCNETTIDMLLQRGIISVRAYNTCRRIGICNIGELLASHRKDTDWMHIYRCGAKTAYEITEFIDHIRKSQAA